MFSVVMALATRLVQSLLCTPGHLDRAPEGMMQVYVDDPLALLRGTAQRERRLACVISCVGVGVPMACRKAALSNSSTWKCVSVAVSSTQVAVEVAKSKVDGLTQLIVDAILHMEAVCTGSIMRRFMGRAMRQMGASGQSRSFSEEDL